MRGGGGEGEGELLRLRRSAAVLAQAGAQLRRATPLLAPLLALVLRLGNYLNGGTGEPCARPRPTDTSAPRPTDKDAPGFDRAGQSEEQPAASACTRCCFFARCADVIASSTCRQNWRGLRTSS